MPSYYPAEARTTQHVCAALTEFGIDSKVQNTSEITRYLFLQADNPSSTCPCASERRQAHGCCQARPQGTRLSKPHHRSLPLQPAPSPDGAAKWNLSLPYYTPPMSKNWAAFFLRCFTQPEPQVGLSYLLIPLPSSVRLSHNAPQPQARPLVSSTPFRDVSFLTSS